MSPFRFSAAAMTAAIAMAAGSCAAQPPPVPGHRVTPAGIVYQVRRDETLSGIARRFTGRVANWRPIGAANRIANDRAIPIGTEVLIPARLLPDLPAEATLRSVSGDVRIVDKSGAMLDSRPGTRLPEGALVITGAAGYASLALDDGTRIAVHPDSRIGLRLLRASQVTNAQRTRLYLESGRIESHVTPSQRRDQRSYEVLSPIAVSGVRGTVFRTGVDQARALNEVLAGRVAVSSVSPGTSAAGTARNVDAGFGSVVTGGHAAAPVSLLRAPELADGYAVQERLPLQFRLRLADADAFRIAVATDVAGSDTIASASAAATEGAAVVKLADLQDGDYHLRFHAIDRQGLWGQEGSAPFRVKARPFPPLLLRPQDKVQASRPNEEAELTLEWTDNDRATGYRVQIAADASFSAPLLDRVIRGPKAMETVRLAPGSYQWRVATQVERNGEPDQGPFGDARALRVIPATPAPAVQQTDESTRFSWSGSAGQRFTFQISDSPHFERLLADQTVNHPSAVLPGLAAGTYFARVRSIDGDGFVGVFSPAQRFIVPARWQSQFGGELRSEAGAVSPGF